MRLLLIAILLITLVSCGNVEREDQALMCIGACSLYESKSKIITVDKTKEEIGNETKTETTTN